MRKILVLRGGALGDFIVTLPALSLLRTHWPSARIELAGNATAAALAQDCGLLDAVHSQHEARWSALFAPAPLPPDLSVWLASFDLVLNFWPDPDDVLRARFPLRADQTYLHGSAHPTLAPAAAHYCEPLRAFGLATGKWCFRLRDPLPTASTIAIHPGSGSPRKNWPLDRWRALMASLTAPILVILGAADLESWSAMSRTRPPRGLSDQRVGDKVLHLAVELPLSDLASELAKCRLFVGHDSGVSHLAAACGVPSVLLFGPTDPQIWAPPCPHVRVLSRGAPLSSLSVDEVRSSLAELL